jgi:DNA-binding transcriptional LysR family regulator
VIAGYLQHTQAVGLLSRLVARPLARSGALAILPLELPDPRRPIGVTWLKQRPLPPAALRLVEFLKQEIKALA